MKKNKKYILLIILAIVLATAAINFNKIRFMFNMVSSYNKFKNDNLQELHIDDNKENIEVVQNPIDKIINMNEDETVGEHPESITDEREEEIVSNKPQKDNTVNKVESGTNTEDIDDKREDNSKDKANKETDDKNKNMSKDQLYKEIVTKYYSSFTSLQEEYEAKITNLIESGYEEYKSGKASTLKLANKYLNLGSKLESESDKKVNSLLKEMEKELKDNNLDTSIVKETKEYYIYLKSLRRSQLMSKAKNYI